MRYLIFTAMVLAGAAQAQGFQDEPTCYSWNGGHKSAGSFSKCPPPMVAAAKPAPPVVAAPVVQSAPVIFSCPPQAATPAPQRKHIVRPKPKAASC